ncbi:MAG: DUF1998 domain-containing protein [Planctomycetes bacterium]|nr:DUF1998 domain-containing protein [Planctomycetota bacterium]
MLDLVDRSVLVGGLELWHGVDHREPIVEDRLKAKVCEILTLPSVRFFAPPVEDDAPGARMAHVGVVEFPTWYLAQVDRTIERAGRVYRTRPLVPGKHLDGGKWIGDDRKKVDVVPVRFVQACRRGHISDIDWYAFVGADRGEMLWLDEGGAGNDFAEIYVRRERGGPPRQLADAAIIKDRVLGTCRGEMPWLGGFERETCSEANRLLTRSASNAYFPQVQSVISIPDDAAALRDAVEGVYEDFLAEVSGVEDIERERRKPKVKRALEGFVAADVWREIERRRTGKEPVPEPVKSVEVRTLRRTNHAAPPAILRDEVQFSARARQTTGLASHLSAVIDRIVLVDRLREVVAQVGFTRFEAAAPDVNGDLSLGVERARISHDLRWLPAIDNKGEGVFLGVADSAITAWLARPTVVARGRKLEAAFDTWRKTHGVLKAQFPGLPFFALHSLAHLLITEVSLSCGYTASAIRERVYAGPDGHGILLYTGGSGSEGTLGGLVEVGRQIEHHVERALAAGRLCSNDPVCAEHEPDQAYEDRFLHGAACHGCLLIAETSCERFNQHLDRALVIPTLRDPDCALFGLPAGTS